MTCIPCASEFQGPQLYNFVTDSGDDFYRELQLIDEITAAPIDISNWGFFSSIYQSYADKFAGVLPLIQIANTFGFTMVSPTLGNLGMFIGSDDTESIPIVGPPPYGCEIPQNNCVYDLVGIDALGFKRVELRGVFTFQARLTIV